MAEEESTKHEMFRDLKEKHDPVDSYDGGSCLTAHKSWYEENDSCSYRWQGLKKAEENRDIYNRHSIKAAHIGGYGMPWLKEASLKDGKSGKILQKLQSTTIVNGVMKRWVKVLNFTNGHKPYANMAHHVLPVSSLANPISEISKEKPELVNVIAGGLLEEKYNINHKDNIMIMPAEWEDARRIGLPTHPQGNNHPNYRPEIEAEVKIALNPYRNLSDQGEKHDKAKAKNLKSHLEDISRCMYGALKDYGTTLLRKCNDINVSVDDIPENVYRDAGL